MKRAPRTKAHRKTSHKIAPPSQLEQAPLGRVRISDWVRLCDAVQTGALEFIRINAGLNIRVSDVADHLGVTRRWVEKRFEQVLNRSVLALTRGMKMGVAPLIKVL